MILNENKNSNEGAAVKRIVLISCVSKKLEVKSKAKELYISPLFKKNLAYAKTLNPDLIFILSAEYGLVALDEEKEPYDKTLNKMLYKERQKWAECVLKSLRESTDLDNDTFIFLAGKKYRQYLIPSIKNHCTPMEGLRIGVQLQYLSKKIKEYECNL